VLVIQVTDFPRKKQQKKYKKIGFFSNSLGTKEKRRAEKIQMV
jgi:hypothetical protein